CVFVWRHTYGRVAVRDNKPDSFEDFLARLEAGQDTRPITRGGQTAWIVGSILVVGAAIILTLLAIRDRGPCENFFGIEDKDCSAERAVRALDRSLLYRYYPTSRWRLCLAQSSHCLSADSPSLIRPQCRLASPRSGLVIANRLSPSVWLTRLVLRNA